jgi:NADPH2:quinone reductase
MKAVRVHEIGGPEVLKYEEVPTPTPGEGELLVRLAASGVNYTDVQLRAGRNPVPLPATPGREGAGVVEALGPGATGFAEGDRVAYAPVQGSYAEYTLLPAAEAIKVPDAMELEMAAAIMLQGMTAHYLVYSTYALQKGDACLIHAGAGGMGLMLIQMAKRIGATVYTTVSTEAKAELARGAGADHVILYTQVDFQEEIERIAGKNPLHAVYDAVGAPTFEQGLNLLRPRGVMALYGAAGGAVQPYNLRGLSEKGSVYVTRPVLSHYTLTREELEWRANDVLNWVQSGAIEVRIERKYPLAEAAAAHQALEGRKTTGKLLLIP